jgi:hypothetical protein
LNAGKLNGGTLPTVITSAVTNIQAGNATVSGNLTSDGGNAFTIKGFCWSTNHNPTTSDNSILVGTGLGTYSTKFSDIPINETCYARAFATNQNGTTFGNEVSFLKNIAIGDFYQGGIVAYILQSGDPGYDSTILHGLIAAASDLGVTQWGCNGGMISGADGTELGTGNQNTIDIMNGCSQSGIAARICGDLVLNGYSDWYLPSKDELNKLFLNRYIIGGFDGWYWSSSETASNNENVWVQEFNTGSGGPSNKNWLAPYVRAVRSF